MLVANKFQTGFDQPLLSAMYVDKRLSGVTAVQTLSRLNRTHRTAGGEQKRKTFVIDFHNKPEDIRASFEPYFKNAALETETDPYVVVHLATKLAHAGIYSEDDVRKVAELWVTRKGNNALSAAISLPNTTSSAGMHARSRKTTGSPSIPSTSSARTSPPTSGSTTS